MFNKLLVLCIVPLAVSLSASAQITPNNSYAQVLTNSNALLQNSISQTIAAQARRSGNASGATPSNWCSPLPPPELQRGADGHVPPELQGDPRYQAWLQCKNGQNTPQAAMPAQPPAYVNAPGSNYPTPIMAYHLPPAATDFTPALPGHPFVEQYLQSQPLTDEQRQVILLDFDEMAARTARDARPNNLAASMAMAICGAIYLTDSRFTDADSDRYYVFLNDLLGASPDIAAMSALQKQNLSDALILQITVAKLLADMGQNNPAVRAQSVQLARDMLLQLTGSPTGRLVY
jgi:hypothetical protein